MKKIIPLIGMVTLLTGCSGNLFVKDYETNVKKEATELIANEQEHEESKKDKSFVLEEDYFNEVVTVDGKNLIQNPDNMLVLVNKVYSISQEYEPQDLVRPNVKFSFGDQKIEKSYMRKDAAAALEKMFNDAENNSIHLFAVSGYRSYETQTNTHDYLINKLGEEEAVKVSASPGTSEHQTGLAMDISGSSVHYELVESFAETVEGKWLMENAHRYGFILRYPKGKEGITGYSYEPWHYRYVGEQTAKSMFENGLTLEEYFNIVEKI